MADKQLHGKGHSCEIGRIIREMTPPPAGIWYVHFHLQPFTLFQLLCSVAHLPWGFRCRWHWGGIHVMGGCCVSVNVAKTKTSEWSGLLLKVRVHWSEEEDRRRGERPSSISISAVKCWSSRFHSQCRRCQRNWRLQQKPECKQENVLLWLLEAGGTFIYLFPLLLWNCCPFKSLSPLVSSVFSPSSLSWMLVFLYLSLQAVKVTVLRWDVSVC